MATKKEIVNEDNFEELLLKSANEALEYTRGEKQLRTHFTTKIAQPPTYSKSKIKKIRLGLGLSQAIFASIFGVTTSAVQHWEQGLRAMPAPTSLKKTQKLFLISSLIAKRLNLKVFLASRSLA
jgi:DNA-binding transcriptional regulator YiaG